MKKTEIYTLGSPYREDLTVSGYSFGYGQKAACIVGSIRGNEIQQLYVCSQIIRKLEELETANAVTPGKEILVIPSVNHHAMNIGKNMPGDFIPHVRMMDTGKQNTSLACLFGLPYVVVRKPRPIDTTTLNYNWQIWDTNAFSLYTTETDVIDEVSARQAVAAVMRFLTRMGILKYHSHNGYIATVIGEEELVSVRTDNGGIYRRLCHPGDCVYFARAREQRLSVAADS